MGGGPSTPELVIAAARAGAFAFLAAGYRSVQEMRAEIAAVRDATREPFGVNVFVPGSPARDQPALARYLATLEPDAAALGVRPGDPRWGDDRWRDKVDALLADPPPLVGFTFGCPPPADVAALQRAGSAVAVTVTSAVEAATAAAAGADLLCVQGDEAGAHRGGFDNPATAPAGTALLDLVAQVAAVTDLPQWAAGAVMTAERAGAARAAGALAVQCGTAFLRCAESGAHPVHKAALADPRYDATTVTRAFSGRPARGLVNGFVGAHPDAPAAYPEINAATRPLRTAAAAAGDTERMSLWAGTGYRQALAVPVREVVALLDPDRH
ncbi:MAG: nitronate monooxygenase [Jatrophihabitans sp.]|nr:MAG: nitronate monooxygenase [Jatrophihabitans sp.]